MNSCAVVSLSVITAGATYDGENHQVWLTAAVLASEVYFIDLHFPVAPEHIFFASASATVGLNGIDEIYGLYSSEAFEQYQFDGRAKTNAMEHSYSKLWPRGGSHDHVQPPLDAGQLKPVDRGMRSSAYSSLCSQMYDASWKGS